MYYWRTVTKPSIERRHVEKHGTRLALMPMVLAERDRAYIQHWKNVVEAEKDLMGGIEDWEVGTWWGMKVYKTVPENKLLHSQPSLIFLLNLAVMLNLVSGEKTSMRD